MKAAAQIMRIEGEQTKSLQCKNYGEKSVKQKFVRTKRNAHFFKYIWFKATTKIIGEIFTMVAQTHILASQGTRKLLLYPLCNVYGYIKMCIKIFCIVNSLGTESGFIKSLFR